MKRPTYQWQPGQKVIRTYGSWRSGRQRTVSTIDSVTASGRAKIGAEVFLPDGDRLGDATAARRRGAYGSPPEATIKPATAADIEEVRREARVRELTSACGAVLESLRKAKLPGDPERLSAALSHLQEAARLFAKDEPA